MKEKEEILVLVTKVEKLQESQKEQSIPKVEEEAEDVDWVNVNKEADVDWGEGAEEVEREAEVEAEKSATSPTKIKILSDLHETLTAMISSLSASNTLE